MRGGAPSASLRRELASIDMTKRNTVVLDSNTLPSASGGLLTKSSSIKIHKRSDMRDVSRDSKNSKMPRSQHVKWPKEHTQESLTFQQAGRFPKILVGGKRDFSGENTGPPSRRFSSRPMRVGKASKRPAGAGIAKTETLNFFQDKMSLTDDGSFPTERTLGQNEADEIAPTAKSRTCLERQTGSGRSMASHGPLSPYDCASRGTDKTKAEMFLATLQQRNQELLLENGYLKEALLASVTNGKLLFLLENNDTADATDERESRTLAVSSWVPGTDKALSSEGSPREGHLQTRRTKSIDLPCVREFFEAVSCCIGPSCRDPPLLPRDGLVALADGFGMDTFHEPPQTIEKLHRSTEDENDGTSIKVDFFPFGHPEDDEAAQTDVNQSEI
ncbi:hypothetical protein, conserved [Eimeria necatrix]|uniref:Uncharacterized protein n=1 Tax=Eimeria necatrix TaxID=51315 RepID=U6MR36_9EIME|nr:hypothetical protein, conserved [Eimeria necatrix]CDJ64949.1 hypothetical protein, conserved [Eimeria necatrix]